MNGRSRFPGYVLLDRDASCETCTREIPAGTDAVEKDGHAYCSKQCSTGSWLSSYESITVLGYVGSVQEAAAVFGRHPGEILAEIDENEKDRDAPTM